MYHVHDEKLRDAMTWWIKASRRVYACPSAATHCDECEICKELRWREEQFRGIIEALDERRDHMQETKLPKGV